MNKVVISAAIVIALASTQVLADNQANRDKMKSKGSMYDGHKRVLQAQCIKMDDPDGLLDGKYLGAEFVQAGSSDMFRFKSAYLMNKEEAQACEQSAEIMPVFKGKEEDEEHDQEGDDLDDDMESDENHEDDDVDSDEERDHDADDLNDEDDDMDEDESHEDDDSDDDHESDEKDQEDESEWGDGA